LLGCRELRELFGGFFQRGFLAGKDTLQLAAALRLLLQFPHSLLRAAAVRKQNLPGRLYKSGLLRAVPGSFLQTAVILRPPAPRLIRLSRRLLRTLLKLRHDFSPLAGSSRKLLSCPAQIFGDPLQVLLILRAQLLQLTAPFFRVL